MSHAKKKVAKRYFDRWAHSYDESILQHIIFKSSHNMLFKHMDVYNGAGADAQLKILDVGCGTGELAYKLAEHYKKSEVHGVDLSTTMVDKANAKRAGHNNIRFEVGDVEDLPYKDNEYDIITCSHSFHHYPIKEKAMSEMHRTLKSKGKLMVIDGCRDVLLGRIIFDIVSKVEKHVYHLFGEEFRELFRKTGFNNIVQKRFNFIPLLLTIGTAIK